MKSILSILFLLAIPLSASAAEFSVTPIRIDLGKDVKSALVNVINSGSRTNLQVYAMEWSQDAEGKDKYTKTNDLIFFPKVLIVDMDETRVVRVGIKANPPAREKTYRLFIEEIPAATKKKGVNVNIAIKFGVPVFVEPSKEDVSGEITGITMSDGVIKALVKNSGNVHFNIESVDFSGVSGGGKEIYKKQESGWYLLSGVTRDYSSKIPREKCLDLSTVFVKVNSDRINFGSKLDVDESMCGS